MACLVKIVQLTPFFLSFSSISLLSANHYLCRRSVPWEAKKIYRNNFFFSPYLPSQPLHIMRKKLNFQCHFKTFWNLWIWSLTNTQICLKGKSTKQYCVGGSEWVRVWVVLCHIQTDPDPPPWLIPRTWIISSLHNTRNPSTSISTSTHRNQRNLISQWNSPHLNSKHAIYNPRCNTCHLYSKDKHTTTSDCW